MVRLLLFVVLLVAAGDLNAQKIESIHFNLYTDSLKKGTHNYINVDGKLSNGKWMPLTAKELQFSSSEFSFSGNELIVPADCTVEKVTVKAVLKSNPALWLEKTIWVKKKPDPELPTKEEVMQEMKTKKKRKRSD